MKYKELVLTVPISYADVVSLLIVDCGGSSAILDEENAPTGSIVLTTYVPADDNESLEQIKHSLRHLADEQDAFFTMVFYGERSLRWAMAIRMATVFSSDKSNQSPLGDTGMGRGPAGRR